MVKRVGLVCYLLGLVGLYIKTKKKLTSQCTYIHAHSDIDVAFEVQFCLGLQYFQVSLLIKVCLQLLENTVVLM